ncbi:MAG: 2-dehydropantoate 2-reductase [Thermoguttaceae bacterium]|nr:2-dehydropantoate 2-reductase [Thermoguttaceae bacterium]MDW8078865.1 2-dehydropantoate 2-reductase [Thermoguttaceae bacterium]
MATIGVLGAGAIGSFFGALLARELGPDRIVLVGRGPHAEFVRRTGRLAVASQRYRAEVPARMELEPAALAGSEFVLFCVKSHGTEEALSQAAPFIRQATVVVIQNGICDQIFQRWLPPSQLVAAVTTINVAVTAPGHISLQLGGLTAVGPMFPDAEAAARKAAAILSKTGMPIKYTREIQGLRYTKLGINAVGYVSCLSASNFITECLLHHPWRRWVAIPLFREIERVYRAAGIHHRAIPGRPGIRHFRTICHLLGFPIVGQLLGGLMRFGFNRRPIVFSLYQDLVSGKKTEVDFINGEIVRLGSEHQTPCPLNELVLELTHELEQKNPRTFLARDEVIHRFKERLQVRRFEPTTIGVERS